MRRRAAVALLAVTVTAAACSKPARHSTVTVRVLAASSLTGAFSDIAAAFHGAHVVIDTGGSSALAQSIVNGAPADVFASADFRSIEILLGTGRVRSGPAFFATNHLEILVAHGNPKGVRGLADLARPGVTVALCAAPVPCGQLADQALTAANVKVSPRTREADVKGVVSKVALGEVDAGVVYETDVKAGGAKVQGVPIAASQNVTAHYPIAVIYKTAHPREAAAFVAFVRSPAGQAILRRAGFGAP